MSQAFRTGVVLVSVAILDEIESVLRRTRFDRYRDLDERLRYLRSFIDATTPVVVHESLHVCRDLSDNKFLELALSGGADVIVTGDADLLCLHPWRGIAILSPADYLAQGV
jgi:putative PIN family toxin of toxin-antitoxin system